MKILAVIPARSGSVGVPDKNVRDFLGRPMFTYLLEHFAELGCDYDIAASTDSVSYVQQFSRHGVPAFMRPLEMRSAELPSFVAVKHVVPSMEAINHCRYDIVLMGYPAIPIRPKGYFRQVLDRLQASPRPDSVLGVTEIENAHSPKYQVAVSNGMLVYPNGLIPASMGFRQSQEQRYRLSGCGYGFWRETIDVYPLTTPEDTHAGFGALRGVVVHGRHECVDIDDMEDLEWAEFLMSRRR